MKMRSSQSGINPLGDVFVTDFETTPVRVAHVQRQYPFLGQRRAPRRQVADDRDGQRFRIITPILVRTPPLRDPC
jgi:hypothetical protein